MGGWVPKEPAGLVRSGTRCAGSATVECLPAAISMLSPFAGHVHRQPSGRGGHGRVARLHQLPAGATVFAILQPGAFLQCSCVRCFMVASSRGMGGRRQRRHGLPPGLAWREGSQACNADMVSPPSAPRVQTRITLNSGAEWKALDPPASYRWPVCNTCKPGAPAEQCRLHLHGPTSWCAPQGERQGGALAVPAECGDRVCC